jgi:hypothetical protein
MRVLSAIACVVLACACGGDGDGDESGVFHVKGTVAGLWDGDALQLRLQGGDAPEILEVSADGEFTFVTDLTDGTTYDVTVANGRPCTITEDAGTIDGADATVTVTCTAPVSVSLTAPVEWTFDSTPADQDVDLSILMQETAFVVTAPGYTVQVDGVTIGTGEVSPLHVLAPGETVVAIALDDGTLSRTYHLHIQRGAAAIESYATIQASAAVRAIGAAIAMEGDRLVTGADLPIDPVQAGAAWMFERVGTTWSAGDVVRATYPSAYAHLGDAVAISGDTIAVGAGDEYVDFLEQGGVYVQRWNGTHWVEEAHLVAPDPAFQDHFGSRVAISGDTIAVGAYALDDTLPDQGAVYVFTRTGTAWTFQQELKPEVPGTQQSFGMSLALSGDVLVVGAPGDRSNATGVDGNPDDQSALDSGAAYVFRRAAGTWTQEAYLKASNTRETFRFGAAVAMSGERVAVGSPFESSVGSGVDGDQTYGPPTQSGAVYMFAHDGSGWSQEAYLKADPTSDYAMLGWRLAFVGDVLAAGALDGAYQPGAVHVFHLDGDAWRFDTKIADPDATMLDDFGLDLALSRIGLAAGSRHGAGLVYLLR